MLTENRHFLANLEHTTSFLVDESGDALDAAATSQTTDGRLEIEKLGQSQNFLQHPLSTCLGDALDVVPEHFAMALGSSLAESLSSFAAAGHCRLVD